MTTAKQLSNVLAVATVAAYVLVLTDGRAQNGVLLFGDTFDRPNSTDLNALAAGKSGSLGPLDYGVKTVLSCTAAIDNNMLKLRENGGGGGGAIIAYPDHNFVGYRWTQQQLEVYKSGGYPTPAFEASVSSYPLPQTMKIDYSFPDFNTGSTVGYDIYLGGRSDHIGNIYLERHGGELHQYLQQSSF